MITQEQYDELNDGDTVTARYLHPDSGEEFEVTSKVYVWDGYKRFVGWNLASGLTSTCWTITEHIPPTPAWHSALVISAQVEGEDGRFLFVWVGRDVTPWYSPALRDAFPPSALSDVKILVDKDVEL